MLYGVIVGYSLENHVTVRYLNWHFSAHPWRRTCAIKKEKSVLLCTAVTDCASRQYRIAAIFSNNIFPLRKKSCHQTFLSLSSCFVVNSFHYIALSRNVLFYFLTRCVFFFTKFSNRCQTVIKMCTTAQHSSQVVCAFSYTPSASTISIPGKKNVFCQNSFNFDFNPKALDSQRR